MRKIKIRLTEIYQRISYGTLTGNRKVDSLFNIIVIYIISIISVILLLKNI